MFTVTTISHKTSDSHHPLIMLTNREGYRYFFGKIPEGTQRILNENRFRLGKLKSIFLTGTVSSWSEIGGLPGLFLTISDSTKKSIEVFTSSGKLMSFVVATWRYFVFRKGVELKLQDTDQNNFICDSNVMIKPIKIPSINSNNLADSTLSDQLYRQINKLVSLMFPMEPVANDPDPASYRSDPSETEIHTHVKLPEPSDLLPSRDQLSVNYLIRFLPIRGKFDPVKAKELGVKPGIDFRKLTQGISILNDRNELIQPNQVMEKPKHFQKMLILDIPNKLYLDNSIACDKWFEKNNDVGEEDIGLVYHFLGDEIDFESQDYVGFLKKFPDECKHVISHSSLADDTLVFKTSAINLLKLKCLQNDNFNLPYIESYRPIDSNDNLYKLHQLQQLHIEPSCINVDNSLIEDETWSKLYDSHILPLNLTNINKAEIIEKGPVSLEAVRGSLKEQVQVVTLGTGSALPSIHRNVISTLVRVPYQENDSIKFRSILLDGGENTLASMMRNFGHDDKRQLIQIFKELDLIHLSHLHADHHLGLISIINKWFEINRDSTRVLYLVIPWQYNNFIKEWYKLESQATKFIDLERVLYFSCEEFAKERQPQFQQLAINDFEKKFDDLNINQINQREQLAPKNHQKINELYKNLRIESIATVRAIHCYWSYSISIKFNLNNQETFKVSYSGDTRPNPKFVEIGYGSDLLIHESSLDNELIEEAIAKKHTTMIEAVNISRFMNCSKLILTHFSTRYSNKANMVFNTGELKALSRSLKDYLFKYGSTPNIFATETSTYRTEKKSFEDLDICFAFDSMNVRLKNISEQREKCKEILELFQTEDESEDNEKREKDIQKQRDKREAKRIQRLTMKTNHKKKRRVSSDEEDNCI